MSLADGKALKVVLGRAASENSLQESLKGLKKKVDAWIEVRLIFFPLIDYKTLKALSETRIV